MSSRVCSVSPCVCVVSLRLHRQSGAKVNLLDVHMSLSHLRLHCTNQSEPDMAEQLKVHTESTAPLSIRRRHSYQGSQHPRVQNAYNLSSRNQFILYVNNSCDSSSVFFKVVGVITILHKQMEHRI